MSDKHSPNLPWHSPKVESEVQEIVLQHIHAQLLQNVCVFVGSTCAIPENDAFGNLRKNVSRDPCLSGLAKLHVHDQVWLSTSVTNVCWLQIKFYASYVMRASVSKRFCSQCHKIPYMCSPLCYSSQVERKSNKPTRAVCSLSC